MKDYNVKPIQKDDFHNATAISCKEKALAIKEEMRRIETKANKILNRKRVKGDEGWLIVFDRDKASCQRAKDQMLSDFEDEKEFLDFELVQVISNCKQCKYNEENINKRIKDLDSAIRILRGEIE